MLEVVLVALVTLATAGGLTARLASIRARRIRSTLRAVKTTLIRDAAAGEPVTIVGTLFYGERTVPSPLRQRTCAYYSIVVEEYRSRGRSGHWHEIVREDTGYDFYLRDESGTALVRLVSRGMSVAALARDQGTHTSPILSNDPDLVRFLNERGMTLREDLRAFERILEEGARIAVSGVARWIPTPDAAGGIYRETPKCLVIEPTRSLPLILSDDKATL